MRALLGDRVTEVKARIESLTVEHFGTPEEFRDYFKRTYGPTIAVYRALADEPERAVALDADLVELARRHGLDGGSTSMEWEYLLLTARGRAE